MCVSACSGDFQFAVSSDDNSEFWLSSDESPLNSRLMAYVGKVSLIIVCFPKFSCDITHFGKCHAGGQKQGYVPLSPMSKVGYFYSFV